MSRTWKYGEDRALRNDPKWWRRMKKHKPRRRETAALEHKVVTNTDTDSMLWPLDQKPRRYYW